MNTVRKSPAPLKFKPDLEDAAKRWNALFEGDIIDRPVTYVIAPKKGFEDKKPTGGSYYENVYGNIDEIIDRAILSAEATFFGGEAVPAYFPTFGPDEVAAFCGAELLWNEASHHTNWSKPFVENWEDALPIRLQHDNPLWKRMLEFYRKGAAKMDGKMLLAPLDLHTNVDMLGAVRGIQKFCFDVIDQPEMIDRAICDAMTVFKEIWDGITQAARMDERGYFHGGVYSMNGTAMLSSDVSCLLSPEMFRRWVLPALEYEAEVVGTAAYHWDGPDALKHADDIIASKGLKILAYVPGPAQGSHKDLLDLMKYIQKGGKTAWVYGTPDEIKFMHRELKPDKVVYNSTANSQDEAEELLEWLKKNT